MEALLDKTWLLARKKALPDKVWLYTKKEECLIELKENKAPFNDIKVTCLSSNSFIIYSTSDYTTYSYIVLVPIAYTYL